MINRLSNIIGFSGDLKGRLFLVITILLAAIRETGIIIFFMMGNWDEDFTLFWKFTFTFLFFISALLTIYYKTISNKEISLKADSENHFKELVRLLFYMGFLTAFILFINFSNLNLFIKFNYYDNLRPESTFTLIISEIFALSLIFLSFLILYFQFKWFMVYRYKRTKQYLILLIYILIYFVITIFIKYEISFEFDYIATFANIALFIFSGVLVWIMFNKHNWVATLPRNAKLKLSLTSVGGIILSSLFLVMIYSDQSFSETSLLNFFTGSYGIVAVSFYYLDIYLVRLFWLTIVSLSTGNIVERKTSEITSLAFLTRFITESVDKDRSELIGTMTNLALNSCQAQVAWTEIYDDKNNVIDINSETIDNESIKRLHSNKICHSVLIHLENPYLVQSVPEHNEFFLFLNYIPNAMSIMAVPIYSGLNRIGTLVVANEEEFGFEQEDINILSAFSDNVRLALENARLVQDSIEKQKYKNELILAHNIQNKLLPQELPQIKNYSVSAFSHPATEVGGDYYDVIKLLNGTYCFIIADVSGKGISASFYMAQLKGIVLSLDGHAETPVELLKIINKTLFKKMEKHLYITISCVSIDNIQGKLSMARAGHMPFFVRHNDIVKEYVPKGLGIGLSSAEFFDKNIEQISVNLQPNDVCLLFTDGINELRNSENKELGYQPIKDLILSSECNSELILKQLYDNLKDYATNKEQHDDMTAIVICFNGK